MSKMKQGQPKKASTRSSQAAGLMWLARALPAIWVAGVHAQAAEQAVRHRSAAKRAFSYKGVVVNSTANLYGTIVNGGTAVAGLACKIRAASSEAALYNFAADPLRAGPPARFQVTRGEPRDRRRAARRRHE